MALPKKKRIPKDAVIGAHVYVIYAVNEDGGPPDIMTQWDGDLPTVLGMLEMAKKTILEADYETRGEWR